MAYQHHQQNQQWGRGGGYQQQYPYDGGNTQYPPPNNSNQYGPQVQAHRGPMTSAATFYPGSDEYMMPEQVMIVSPAPQRVMPEVPDQITDSLNNLEIQADSSSSSSRRGAHGNMSSPRGFNSPPGSRPLSGHGAYTMPTMSPAEELAAFPQLINPGPNIPPTDEEKAAQIEDARQDVLSSNDPEMQLVWAQDALNYVEVTLSHLTRIRGGSRPQTPPLERTLRQDAMSVVNFLADQHHPRAEFMRGNWLEFGKFGTPTDKKEAFRCYARSAEKGFARAEYRMGMQFENSNEPMKAIRHYNRGAAEGDSASNYRLGMMTLLGQHGQTQDFARGVELIRTSAEYADENAPQGAYVYGLLLSRELPGIDVPEAYLPMDIDLAREMIEKAAFLGFARAQLKMGSAYELCLLNCDFNPALSMHYNLLAARQGESEAEMAISKWFLCGHEGVFDKNEELAYVYAKRAATANLATAEFALGYFSEIGMFVPKDVNEAKYWYEKAASHGNKDASSRLDGISRSNTLSRQDHEKVAIAAIKSRHGSMRGKNPRTARQSFQKPSIAPITEAPMSPTGGSFQMPEPGADYSNDYPPPGGQYPGQGGPLNTSFIRTDGGPGPNSGIPPRAGSAAPYPLGNAMEGPIRPNTATGTGYGSNFHPRQSSLNNSANSRLSVASLGPGMIPPAGTYPPPGSIPPRAGSAAPQGGFHRPGPQGPYGGPQGPPPGRPTPGPGGRGQFGPGPGPLSPPPHDPYGPPQRPGPDGPGLIGFEAPSKPQQAPRPPRSPGPNMQGGPGGRASPRPGTAASMHKPNSPLGSPMSGNFPRPGVSQTPPRGHTPQPPPATQPAPSKPPGKGPKTFEEMGVPVQKEEQDCVIM
ncbi:HCP-like protein [Ascodesmis nigricans]|uniref:HCP-like protein n=1 Tax=Ascodesmis nigricans TaxID=341454 RepID=A0A4S2MUJ2_9PEZI|nr:HCP-like protein [Ascodesmis nigricans]